MPGISQLKNYFHFNRGERNGLIVLFIILMAILVANLSIPFWVKHKQLDFTEFEAAVNTFNHRQEQIADSIESMRNMEKRYPSTSTGLKPFPFNPNGLPAEEWLRMGLTEKQTRVIKNYEKKGGRFLTPDDLSKIYSITKEDFQILRPYIRLNNGDQPLDRPGKSLDPFRDSNQDSIAGTGTQKDQNTSLNDSSGMMSRKNPEASNKSAIGNQKSIQEFTGQDQKLTSTGPGVMLNINKADTIDLQQLKGIGPSFARRIFKYREMLGGYFRKEQLLEVYGMDTLRYTSFSKDFFIDTLIIRKIDVNKASIKDFMAHPYFEYYLAKILVGNRQKNGLYPDLLEIKKQAGIPDELFRKIRPYLKL